MAGYEVWPADAFRVLTASGALSKAGVCPEDLSWASGAKKNLAWSYYVKKYEALQTTFNPTKFDPSNGQTQPKEAGM